MAGRVVWHGDKAIAMFQGELHNRVAAGVRVVLGRARKLISVEGTTVLYTTIKHGKNAGKQRQSGRIYNTNPSKPGDPPHKQTGHLRRSVAAEVEGVVGRVGTNLNYGRWLEFGTARMAARPWLRRAFNEVIPQIRALMNRPMK